MRLEGWPLQSKFDDDDDDGGAHETMLNGWRMPAALAAK
jgi:hypothetical protein